MTNQQFVSIEAVEVVKHNMHIHENTIYDGNFHLLKFDVGEPVVICFEC